MKKIEIKLTDLPKYKYDIIINNLENEFGVDIDKNNDIRINIYADRNKGINAEVINKFNISKKNKDIDLWSGLVEFINNHVLYQYGGIVDIKTLYNNYKEYCIYMGKNYYQSISAFRTHKFDDLIRSRNMTNNKDVIYNAIYASKIIKM